MFGNRQNEMANIPSVLIYENDPEQMILMSYNLKRHGFTVYKAHNIDEVIQQLEVNQPSLVIVDYKNINKKEDISIIDICTNIRETNKPKAIPIINIVHLDEDESNSNWPSAEEGGADEYIASTASSRDLVNKVKTLFRNTRNKSIQSKSLVFDDITLNLLSYKVKRAGKEIRLGPTEFKILQCLMENPKRTLHREFIMKYVWGEDHSIEPRTIDVHINRLRQALKVNKEHENEPPIIVTIRSGGYTLRKTVVA